MSNQSKSAFLKSVCRLIRAKHLSRRTEKAYIGWIQRYLLFHDKRHPKDLGAEEVQAFLKHLAVDGNVAASTQNQASAALVFLYHQQINGEENFPPHPLRRGRRYPKIQDGEYRLAKSDRCLCQRRLARGFQSCRY